MYGGVWVAISPSLELFIAPPPPTPPPPLIIDIRSQFCKDEKPIFAVKPCRLSRKMVLPPIFIFICLKGLCHDFNIFWRNLKLYQYFLYVRCWFSKMLTLKNRNGSRNPPVVLKYRTGSHLGHILFQRFFHASNEGWKLEKVDLIFFVFIFLFDQTAPRNLKTSGEWT